MKHLGVSALILALGTTLVAAPQSTPAAGSTANSAPSATTHAKTHKKVKTKRTKTAKKVDPAAKK